MICENCNSEHDGKFGSGRFCKMECSRAFSTKNKRKEINEKVSKSLTGRQLSNNHVESIKESWKKPRKSIFRKQQAALEDIFIENSPYATQYVKRIILKQELKTYVCEECGICKYNGKKLTLQLHHVNGNNKDHRLENLQLLCPNCHSQTDNYAGKKFDRVAQLDRAPAYEAGG